MYGEGEMRRMGKEEEHENDERCVEKIVRRQVKMGERRQGWWWEMRRREQGWEE